MLYKLKVSGYKYSWALIPLSVPFLWLLFFYKRNVHLYDHAIFATYSISFVMLLVILLAIASLLGAPEGLWPFAFFLIVVTRGRWFFGFTAPSAMHLRPSPRGACRTSSPAAAPACRR